MQQNIDKEINQFKWSEIAGKNAKLATLLSSFKVHTHTSWSLMVHPNLSPIYIPIRSVRKTFATSPHTLSKYKHCGHSTPHTHTYIHIYGCVCVCVYVLPQMLCLLSLSPP